VDPLGRKLRNGWSVERIIKGLKMEYPRLRRTSHPTALRQGPAGLADQGVQCGRVFDDMQPFDQAWPMSRTCIVQTFGAAYPGCLDRVPHDKQNLVFVRSR
jgi:hypothetical protein